MKRRLNEHKSNVNPNSFTSRYNVHHLLYYEKFTWIQLAIEREKEIKNWTRAKKDNLINEFNPETLFLNKYFED
ncbi:GIY-YIG nuclease family protein [Flavobacterium sp. SM2513]|uniref:GIY-YIG nuclease family protein n=1 Tax=Flavobacterium sp. SM2513 TaxID=3424766 RepID=UPI003D7F723A